MNNLQSVLSTIFIFVVGACAGSFINVLIYRIPRKIQFVQGVSLCPQCSKRIMPRDLIPIWSYIVLGGKCRRCKFSISLQYPIVESLAGTLAALAVWTYSCTLLALIYFLILAALLTIAVIDAEHMLIPNGLVAALAVFSIVYVFIYGNTAEVSAISRITGFFTLSLPMFLLTLIIKDAFGGGDIKLIAVCGFLLGIRFIIWAGFIAVLLGACKGIYIKYITRNRDITHIAFGQYICLGVFFTMQFVPILLHFK